MQRSINLIIYCAIAFLITCPYFSATAQDDYEKAYQYFTNGWSFYKQAKYNNAVTALQQSNRAAPAAVTWYFLGLCYNEQRKSSNSHPSQVTNANNAMYAMNQALQLKDPALDQKFTGDANFIISQNQDVVSGKTYYVGGQALTHLAKIPDPADNPNLRKAYKIPNDRIFLPQDGAPNNGNTVGDFCCDGYTATMLRNDNMPLGYVFFYAREAPSEAATPRVRILISAAAGLTDLAAKRVFDEIDFDVARELYPNAFKKKRIGGFTFEITVLNVTRTSNGTFSDLRIQVDIK